MVDSQQESRRKMAEVTGLARASTPAVRAFPDLGDHGKVAGERVALVERFNALVELGAREMDAHDPVAARRAFEGGAEVARLLHRPDLLAKAAIGLGKIASSTGAGPGIADLKLIALLEEALAAIGPDDTADKALLLARLAGDLYWTQDRDRALRVAKEALEMARRIHDAATLIAVLNFRQWMLWGPDNLEQRVATASEMAWIAEQVRNWDALLRARQARVAALLEMGEIHEVDAEIAAIGNLIRSVGVPNGDLERYRAMRAMMRGELDDAERWLAREFAIAQQRDDRSLLFTHAGQHCALLVERGRAADLLPILSGTSAEVPQLPSVRTGIAVACARTNRIAQARNEFEYLAADDFAAIPKDWNWLGTIANLTEVCVRIGDLERASILYRMIAPYAGRAVTLGYGDVYCNSACHYLGILSAAMGETDRALREFESSIRFNRRIGACVALGYTQIEYAGVLLRMQGRPETARANEMLGLAREAAETLHLDGLRNELARVTESSTSQTVSYPASRAPRSQVGTFRREGDVWTLLWGEETVRLRHLKGLQLIAHLLERPGQAIHVAELAELLDRKEVDAAVMAAGSSHGGVRTLADTGPILDAEAKQAYRARLRELRRELTEAESMNDPGRCERIGAEIDFLEAELIRAVGLGGRDRRGPSVSERIRVRVTNLIRAGVASIAEHHPAMGHHLRVSIQTGTLCSYSPDPGNAPKWIT